jgi:hypothetical protein
MVYNNQEVVKMTYFENLGVIYLNTGKVTTRLFYPQLVSVSEIAC